MLLLLLAARCAVYADSVVVFNEVMYHPAADEPAREWLELHNQMAVNVDLSRWRIRGGISFTFAEGTTIPGKGYLVISAAPEVLRASTGLTNVLGPFTGRLANNREELELVNNSGRTMDRLEYQTDHPWPVAPDGSGVSLAKRDEDLSSTDAESWSASLWAGGTPGTKNFPTSSVEVSTYRPVEIDRQWRFDVTGTQPPTEWAKQGFDDSAWGFGPGLFAAGTVALVAGESVAIPTLFSTGMGTNSQPVAPGSPDAHYWFVESAYPSTPPPTPARVILNHPAWTPNSPTSRWIGPVNPGTTELPPGTYTYRTEFDLTDFDPSSAAVAFGVAVDNTLVDVLLNGVSKKITYAGFADMSRTFGITTGFRAGINTLDFITRNDGTTPSPAGLRLLISGTAREQLRPATRFTEAPVASYFRTSFVLDSATDVAPQLSTVVADGAVFYLNGREVLRLNLPAGLVDASTRALTNVMAGGWQGPFALPSQLLVPGTNILAAEVHAADQANHLLFGGVLTIQKTNVLIPPPISLAFNELGSATNAEFFVELQNYGATALDTGGFVIARQGGATNRNFVLPPRTVEPGGFLVLTKADLGFAADPGDRLFLYGPGTNRVIDAVVAKRRPLSRHPDGNGPWLVSSEVTQGMPNVVRLMEEVVFNEIMYQAPPLPAAAQSAQEVSVLTFTNAWRYHADATPPPPSWTAPGFNDAPWPTGNGGFYNSTSVLPMPMSTELPLVAATDERIISYYFRTPFVLASTNGRVRLSARMVLDDGAIMYLNGLEIFRTNMPPGPVTYSTLANRGVATASAAMQVNVDVTNAVNGTNWLAVEVHQFTTNPIAADVAFGLELATSGGLSPAVARRDSPEQWVELYNRGTNTIDLSGWRIEGDAEATFTAGTFLRAGEYLLVAGDPEFMRAHYPQVNLAAAFNGRLSRRAGALVLRDAVGNPADQVRYFDSGEWPSRADGGGSSLELRDPRANRSAPGAWAASAVHAVPWSNYVYRAAAVNQIGPTLWREFVLGLLDAGECLIDDLRVVEAPDTAPRDLLQNGNFETGLNAWRAIGNHCTSRVEPDPDNPGNHVLHLVATGPTEHLHNHLETTLANGAEVVNGRVYEISFRAKWLSGNNHLNTRLYFNRVARTTALPMAAQFGTPGAPNSVFTNNIGPTIEGISHSPAVPTTNQPVTITALVSDPDGVAQAQVRWRVDGGSWRVTAMTATSNSTPADAGRYEAVLPAQPAGSLVQFYIEARDALAAISRFPADGPESRVLYRVDSGDGLMTQLNRFRLLMPPEDADLLHAPTNLLSNDHLKATVVYNEREVFYNVGLHLQGSERGRNDPTRVGFHVRFNRDHLFRGSHNNVVIDRSGGPAGIGGRHEEILLWHAVNHAAGGLLGLDCDLVQVTAPRPADVGTGLLRMAAFDSDYFNNQLGDGGDGELYTLELIYYPLQTLTGDPQGPKLPQPDEVLNVDLMDRGSDPESYRWILLQENRADLNSYDRIIALNKAFSLGSQELPQRIGTYIDVDQWMRGLAFKAFNGDPDTFTYGLNHNWRIYLPGDGGPALGLLWDMDLSYLQGADYGFPGNGSSTMARITALPDSLRRYYHHLASLADTTLNARHLQPWANHYAGLLGEDWSKVVAYLQARAGFIKARLPASAPLVITSNGGLNFGTSSNQVVLRGTAPLLAQTLTFNGLALPVTWTSMSNWAAVVSLPEAVNLLNVGALDAWGNVLSNAADAITITNVAAQANRPVVINEWMADNAGPGGFADPFDGAFQDWVELYNPNAEAVNLSGYYLTDNLAAPFKWQIPQGTAIAGHGFLLVWADGEPEQNSAGAKQIHAGFKLSRSGQDVALVSPNGAVLDVVQFGPQAENVSEGRFPDGAPGPYYRMENWTPGAANRLGAVPTPQFVGVLFSPRELSLRVATAPFHSYQVEFSEDLSSGTWVPLGKLGPASEGIVEFITPVGEQPQGFYRVSVLQ